MIRKYSYKTDKDKYLSKHFQVKEFRSYNEATKTLTTDEILIDDNLITMLEKLYDKLDSLYKIKSIKITSGYRSKEFELSLTNGVLNSQHMQGKGADIIINKQDGKTVDPKLVCVVAEIIGFKGIGYGKTYTHVDVRDNKSYFDETNGKTKIDSFKTYFNINIENNNSTTNDTTNNNTNTNTNYKYKIGDKVIINGIYLSSDSNERLKPRITNGIITSIKNNAKNPYLLNGGNVGWANDSVIVNNNNYLQNKTYTGKSIVDALNLINIDSSFEYRKKLATVNGINNYTGTEEQNIKLLNLLKEGKLIKA